MQDCQEVEAHCSRQSGSEEAVVTKRFQTWVQRVSCCGFGGLVRFGKAKRRIVRLRFWRWIVYRGEAQGNANSGVMSRIMFRRCKACTALGNCRSTFVAVKSSLRRPLVGGITRYLSLRCTMALSMQCERPGLCRAAKLGDAGLSGQGSAQARWSLWRLPDSPKAFNHDTRNGAQNNDSRGALSDRGRRGVRRGQQVTTTRRLVVRCCCLLASDQKRRFGDEYALGAKKGPCE